MKTYTIKQNLIKPRNLYAKEMLSNKGEYGVKVIKNKKKCKKHKGNKGNIKKQWEQNDEIQ